MVQVLPRLGISGLGPVFMEFRALENQVGAGFLCAFPAPGAPRVVRLAYEEQLLPLWSLLSEAPCVRVKAAPVPIPLLSITQLFLSLHVHPGSQSFPSDQLPASSRCAVFRRLGVRHLIPRYVDVSPYPTEPNG